MYENMLDTIGLVESVDPEVGKAMNQDIGKNVQIVVTKQLRKNMEQMEENMKTQQHVQNQDINNMFA